MSVRRQYQDLGSVNQYPELSLIHNAIFQRIHAFVLSGERTVYTKRFKGGTLYAVDLDGLRYVEQNPNTRSAYADRARSGARILWIIRKSDGEYLGYVEAGTVYKK